MVNEMSGKEGINCFRERKKSNYKNPEKRKSMAY